MTEAVATAEPAVQTEALMARPIVAIAREDFQPAQERMILVIEAKRAEQEVLAADLRENLEIAKRNKWRHTGLLRALKNAEGLVTYYSNIKAALEAGYVMMPNLDCDVFAVRTRDNRVPVGSSSWWRNPEPQSVQPEPNLPVGEGEYVSDVPEVHRHSRSEKDGEKDRTRYYVEPVDVQAPATPLILARPVLLDALQHAMVLKAFDEIGIVGVSRRARRGDPMLLGRILDPTPRGRVASFFIAWWMDPGTL